MKYFQDTQTGQIYALEDEVIIHVMQVVDPDTEQPYDSYKFFSPYNPGIPLNLPDRMIYLEDGLPTPPEPPEPPLEELKSLKLAEINSIFESAADSLTSEYPPGERLTWAIQQQEALAWEADPESPTPYLDGLAASRGITPEDMRQKTLDQTKLFMAASQSLVGTRQKLRDLIYEAESPEDLDLIQWPTEDGDGT